uniref:Uncharacterized protein n=1 Tax=Fagus sylvatica TaxID=28930 RepID=A0A2N9J5S9_FAGSY
MRGGGVGFIENRARLGRSHHARARSCFWRSSGTQNGSCGISSESSRRPLSNDIKFARIGVRTRELWLPEVGVSELFSCTLSGEDSGQTGDAIGEPRVPRRSRSHYLSNAPGLADQLVASRKDSAREGGFFRSGFRLGPDKFLAIREFHVVHECVLLSNVPGLADQLVASQEDSVRKRGNVGGKIPELSAKPYFVGLFSRAWPCTEASLGSQDMILANGGRRNVPYAKGLVSRLQALTTLVEKRDIDGMLPIGSAVNFICLSNGILHHLVQWGCHGFGDAWDCHGFDVWGVHGFGAWDRRGYGGACGFPTTLMHGITMAMMICHDFGAWDCHGYRGACRFSTALVHGIAMAMECRFSMDSYDLGVSGDTTDLVQLTMEFVDEDVVPLNVEADVLECRTVGSQSVEELGDKRADFKVVMVDEDFEVVIIDEVVPPSIRKFDRSAHGGTVDLVEAIDAAEPKLLENLAKKPPSGQ